MKDGLHHVAFRRGLGAPLYTSFPYENTLASLNAYKDTFISTNNISIHGENVDQGELVKLLTVEGVKEEPIVESLVEKSIYYGGEERISTGTGSMGHLGIGFKAPSLSDLQHDACMVLKFILHAKSSIKHGGASQAIVNKQIHYQFTLIASSLCLLCVSTCSLYQFTLFHLLHL